MTHEQTEWFERPQSSYSGPRENVAVAIACLTLAILVCALGGECLARPLNHDEEQFVASGALLARQGLLPYVAYPYFHLPNLVFVFAGLFLTNDHLLLTARAFNFAGAAGLLIVVLALAGRVFTFAGRERWLVAGAATLALWANPFFQFTAGRAWNHDLPMLASLSAFLLLVPAVKRRRTLFRTAAAAFLIAVAMGTRLTLLPLIIPFLLLVWFGGCSRGERMLHAGLFVCVVSFAMLPTLILFVRAPDQFLFDNLTYNESVNLLYRQNTVPSEVRPIHKLLFPLKQLAKSPSTLGLAVGFFYLAAKRWRSAGWREFCYSNDGAVALVLPFLLLGAWMPTPSYRQYYYELIPFLLLAVLFSMAALARHGLFRWSWQYLLALGTLGLLELIPDAARMSLTPPSRWPVFTVHEKGVLIRRLAGDGPILTLAPIFPLEGGATIYKEFATGPFAWRTAPFLSEKQADTLGFIRAQDLAARLEQQPPSGIFTGWEAAALEIPLIEYARSHGYKPRTLKRKREVLWIKELDTGTTAFRQTLYPSETGKDLRAVDNH